MQYTKFPYSVSGLEPIVWKQAKLDNPHPDKLIPTPLIGFQELARRTKCQEYETKQHQQRLDVILVIPFLLIHLSCYFLSVILTEFSAHVKIWLRIPILTQKIPELSYEIT